ncbi:YncE family protein [Alloacidobacterium sp.]|uniref:YncE family protein n=1 Tax=Alloacidobacterium sp. TaxID=2951999 RepID=UPI002D35CB04|nr:YncE family protein [Alloacidobacterium sp.]HYK34477.1 YncE family protein [Alloacidobacterium sp.]
MRSVTGYTAGALLALAGVCGCGNQYRPVVTPITPTGPAPQPQSFVVAFSQPGLTQGGVSSPCPGTPYSQPGVVTLVDFSGDNVMALATVGTGPLTFALDSTGSTAYSTNCDGTVSTIPISTTLQTKNVLTTTLPENPGGVSTLPTNLLATTAGQYVVEQNRTAVGAMTGSPTSLKQEIAVAPSLVNVIGSSGAQYVYAVSQGNSTSGSGVTWGQCDPNSGAAVTTNGEADGIQVSTNTVNSRLPLGICPVYGLMTADGRRAFVLNRGSGTITVIDSSKNALDTDSPSQYMTNATISVGKGPVYADLYTPASLLVTANYDDDSISIISVPINGPVEGFTDTPNFGQVLATVKLKPGSHPAAVTILQDGSRAYVADEGDGTVTVVNLSSFTVESVIPVNGHPRSIASTFNAPIGKVYTVAQDSPYLTVIRTDTDIVTSSILLQGNGVDVHTTTQYAGTSSATTLGNSVTQSRSVGSGAP